MIKVFNRIMWILAIALVMFILLLNIATSYSRSQLPDVEVIELPNAIKLNDYIESGANFDI